MSRQLSRILLFGFFLSTPCLLMATPQQGIYKLKNAINKSNLEKAKRAIKLAGPLDPGEKQNLIEMADAQVEASEDIRMNGWDKFKLIGGCLLAYSFVSAFQDAGNALAQNDYAAMEAGRHRHDQSLAIADTARILLSRACFNGALGVIGLLLIRNGWQCNAARQRLDQAKKILAAVEAAPQRSFNAVQSKNETQKELITQDSSTNEEIDEEEEN